MNLIFTAAGQYSRFREAGYNIPKYLLPYGNGTILSEILDQLVMPTFNFAWSIDKVYVVVHQKDKDYFGHVKSIMWHRCVTSDHLLVLNETNGQAHTAFQALNKLQLTGPVLIANVDTILYNRDIRTIQQTAAAGYIDVFNSNNHSYSYVLAHNHQAEVISEKVLISNLASSGLYGFSSSQMFLDHYRQENYISQIYTNMIAAGQTVAVGPTYTEKETLVLGTPEDYLNSSRTLI